MAMHKIEWSDWDPAEEINSAEEVLVYLDEVFKDDNLKYLGEAVDEISRSQGLVELARMTGLDSAELSRAFLANGKPTPATVATVLTHISLCLYNKEVAAENARKPVAKKPVVVKARKKQLAVVA
jgi:probable addiction module antidote protein